MLRTNWTCPLFPAQYEFDGLGRQIVKTAGGTTRHSYYSSQWQILEERLGTATNAQRQYVWGPGYVDELLLRDRNADGNSQTGDLGLAGSGLEERIYALQDANFNVVALADSGGTIQERYWYMPYGGYAMYSGSYVARCTSSYAWEHLYTGRHQDPETTLYDYRTRPYHFFLGRFTSRDRIGYWGGDANLYRYVGNDPIDGFDPGGELDWKGAVRGGVRRWSGVGPIIDYYSGLGHYYGEARTEGWNPMASGGWAWANQAMGLGIVRSEYQRGTSVYTSARDSGYGPCARAGLTGSVVVGDVIGATDFEDAVEGQRLLTNERLDFWERAGSAGTGVQKWLTTSVAVYGFYDALPPRVPRPSAPAPGEVLAFEEVSATEATSAQSSLVKWDATHPLIEGTLDAPRSAAHTFLQQAVAEDMQALGCYQRVGTRVKLSEFSGLKHSPDIMPDNIGLTTGGRIDMIEIMSKWDRRPRLESKLLKAMDQLPPEMQGGIGVIDPMDAFK